MRNFYIITNEQKDEGLLLTRELQDYIRGRGGVCEYAMYQWPGRDGRMVDADQIPEGTECVFCIGGDGTLIRAARDVLERQVPLIGVNRGHVGYLCELDSETAFSAVDELMRGNYMVENRMLLNGGCEVGGRPGETRLALNDIVICRSGMLQVVSLIVYVNGEYLNTYSADGIVVATPTGSTAYSMSAGGPIVDPRAELLLITPISPHSLNSKSIVLGAEDEIVIEVGSRRKEGDETVEVGFDGDSFCQMHVGDKIFIRRAKAKAQILKLSKRSFLEILRRKMQEYT